MAKKKRDSGQEKKTGPKSKSILIFVDAATAENMTAISKETGIKRHELVTEAVNDWIRKHPKKPIPSIREALETYMKGQSADAILLAREEAELADLKKKVEKRKKKVDEK